MTEHWMGFIRNGMAGFGKLTGDSVEVYDGDLFAAPRATRERVALADLRPAPPCRPGKLIGLWNNFAARAQKEGWQRPVHPLWFIKTDNSYAAHDDPIRPPRGVDGPVVFEGELGIVIGRTCRDIDEADADRHIFGYTCVNDVTARGILKADASFPQWCRAKSYDGFGPFGPVIATGLDPDLLTVVTRVNGKVMQDDPVADMFYRPREIVAALSRDMTLQSGDLIACGTSLGAGPMEPGDVIEVEIAGIGVLRNRFG